MQVNGLQDADAVRRSKHLALEMHRSLAQGIFLGVFLCFCFVVSMVCENPEYGSRL